MPNRTEIRIGGSGGQGIVLAAQILGKAAALEGKQVLQTQAYGAEARGSLAKSEVIISESKIGFPAVRKCDVLVAMTQEALTLLLKDLKETGILIVDSTNIKTMHETKAEVHRLPITQVAKEAFGETIQANMVMIGVLTRITGLAGQLAIEKAIRETVSEKTSEINIEAFRKGLHL